MGLIAVYSLFMTVELLAIAENIIRNLEHIGFSETTAKPFWGWDWIYHNFEIIKRTLLGLEFLVIWSCIRSKGQKNRLTLSKARHLQAN